MGAYARVLSRMDDDEEAMLPAVHKSRTINVNQPPRVKRVRVWGEVYDDDGDNKHSCQRGAQAEFAVTRV